MLQVHAPVLASARYEKDGRPEQVEADPGGGHVHGVLWPEGTSEGGPKKESTLQELQDEIERCRIANEEMKRAVNDERERYVTTIRDLKLLCLVQDDAEVARAQSRLRQYHGLRHSLAENSLPGSASTESDRFVLDQIATLNAELDLALAEKQAQKQKRSLNGLRGQPSLEDDRCRAASLQRAGGQGVFPERRCCAGLRQELLLSVTALQQENQRLYEENVQIRRTLAAHGKASDGYPLKSRRPPRGRACMSKWSKLLRGRDGGDWMLSETKVRRFLEHETSARSSSFSQADLAKSILAVYRNTEEKLKYYRSRNRVLQARLAKQRSRGSDARRRQDGKEADVGDEAFSLEWKVGTLEAEISRLKHVLELSTGTCLSLATIHKFFLEQKTILQKQLEGEQEDIEALEDECSTMKEMRLMCFAEEDETADAAAENLSCLVGEAGEASHRTRRATGLPSNADAVEEAFLAAYEGVMNAVEALKTRHAQTTARLAQIQTGLISVEQDLKLRDKEQRSQIEKHMQDLNDAAAEYDGVGAGWNSLKPCYVRQTVGPGSADREAQTDNSGIASRRHLYTGDFAVSDSTSAPVTVSIINEEDIVVKLMLDDMEFPPCLYTAIAAIKFPEGSRTGESTSGAEKAGQAASRSKGEATHQSENARRETRRNVMKRRRLADETDGKLIANMLEVEYARGTPCLILKDQQEPAATSQDSRPLTSYVEDCLYNDKLSFCHALLVYGTPLLLLMIQCAKRRYGMLFFHLCMYNSLSGWVKYVSLPSKEICRRFGHSGDRQLLEALGGLKRGGKVSEAATVNQIIRLFKGCFASDAKTAATSPSASPTSRPFEPEVILLCGSLTLGEKSEILKEQQIHAAKLRQTNRKSKHLEAQRSPLTLDASRSGASMQDASAARSASVIGLSNSLSGEEKPDEASVFLQLKICIDWDCYLDVSCEFEQ
ncbi:conserved hypothetical protein [Neospora caninum Liverpool]|uniref:Uncharacterized protein n=1 Tax=Neospora caninum (strain Liverpool) TaxID=572307 RepID=F0VPS7_NEOCL|nr:conserved hypothetical protein [Neospora caninum Liverpool]CBZ55724.1 conserved hypothetical protein [Neospora caninum Liverpool]|eukprot:XP_003885750.1 conserved hypothetical protein [Neospora caninum Liverpool]